MRLGVRRCKPRISVIIVTFNSLSDIGECIDSILSQKSSKCEIEIIVVDNNSIDGTPEYVRSQYPNVKVIRNSTNLGYSGGNLIGLKYATGDYIFILNPDIILDENCISSLIRAIETYPNYGLYALSVMLYDEPTLINAAGNEVHITGLTFSRLYRADGRLLKDERLIAPSGAAFVISRSIICKIGFFDSDFFMDFADTDLAVRAWIAGHECILVSSAKVYHKYKMKIHPKRFFFLERGRYLLLLKNFEKRTLLFLMPALILTEILTWGYALRSGKAYVISKLAAYRYIAANRHKIAKKRSEVQRLRVVGDRELFKLLSYKVTIPEDILKNGIIRRIIEHGFNCLYSILRRVIIKLLNRR